MQLMLRSCVVSLFALTAALASAQESINPEMVLFSKSKTLYAGESVLLDLPGVDLALWSSTGRHLLYQKISSDGTRSFHVANLGTVKTRVLELPNTQPINVLSSRWLAKSTWLVIALGEGEDKSLHWVSGSNGKAQELKPWGNYKPITTLLSFSPTEPMAVLSVLLPGPTVGGADVGTEGQAFVEKCYLLAGDGGVSELKAPLTGFGVNALWSEDGKRAFVKKSGPPDEPPSDEIFELDLKGGESKKVEESEVQLASNSFIPAQEVEVHLGRSRISNSGTQRDIFPLWLETRELDGPNRVLISANAEWGQLSPDGRNLAYIADGALLVRRITEIERSAYAEAQERSVRLLAIEEAREVGLALAILGSENENLLPPPSTFRDEVSGYLEDSRILERFVYTFPGGRVSELREPSKMELGFIPLKDGRVVLYADNSVKWVPL
jgi:hypothetical protein